MRKEPVQKRQEARINDERQRQAVQHDHTEQLEQEEKEENDRERVGEGKN